MDWAGTIAGVATPLRDDQSIDWASFEAHLETFVGCGLTGVVVNADTGEGGLLAADEREDVLRFAVRQIGDRVPVTTGLVPAHTAAAAESARSAGELGAAALQVFPPPVFMGEPLAWEPVAAYYEAIAAATDAPRDRLLGARRPGSDLRDRRAQATGRDPRRRGDQGVLVEPSAIRRRGGRVWRRPPRRGAPVGPGHVHPGLADAEAPTGRCWPSRPPTPPPSRPCGRGAGRPRRPTSRPPSIPTSSCCSRRRCAISAPG